MAAKRATNKRCCRTVACGRRVSVYPDETQNGTMSALDTPTDERHMARGPKKATNPQALLGYEAQLWTVAGWGSTASIVLRPKPSLPRELAYRLGRSHESREFSIPCMAGASRRQHVPAESLSHDVLAVSPQNLASEFGTNIKPAFTRASAVLRESRIFARLRYFLIPRLISGEVALRDTQQLFHAIV